MEITTFVTNEEIKTSLGAMRNGDERQQQTLQSKHGSWKCEMRYNQRIP